MIEKVWSGDVTDIRVLPHFEFKIYKDIWTYQVFMCWIALNILEQNVSKLDKKNFELIKSLCAKLFIFKCIFREICPKKITQEKNCQNVKMTMLKWLDIHKDFWTISSGKIFQYSQTVYIRSITQ